MRTTRSTTTVICIGICIALLATACTRDDKESSSSDSSSTAASEPASTGKAVDFGTLTNVCQPGDAKGSPTQGVTDDEIRVATFSDAGFTGRPGLNQELFDSGEVFTKWCNDAGGINGRKLVLDQRDAALTNDEARMVESCDQDFASVGGGAVFDNNGVETRLECMLPDIPGFLVTPEARGSDLQVQPLPNPPGALQIGDYRWLGKKFPDSTDHIGVLTGDLPTTVKVANDDREAIETLGWKVVYSDQYPAAGTSTWTPYAQALKDKGVRGLIWVGEPEGLAKLEQAMQAIDYNVDWIRAPPNHNDQKLLDLAGPALKNTYVWTSFVPFNAKDNSALRDYLAAFAKYKPDAKTKAYLGLQSWSAWLLFAQAARDCGADLTRTCLYNTAKKIRTWTGGGLHAPTDPGGNTGSGCFAVLKASPKGFTMVDVGATRGIYNCNKNNAYFLNDNPDVGVHLSDVGKTLADLQ